jgi:hypothetical protein
MGIIFTQMNPMLRLIYPKLNTNFITLLTEIMHKIIHNIKYNIMMIYSFIWNFSQCC